MIRRLKLTIQSSDTTPRRVRILFSVAIITYTVSLIMLFGLIEDSNRRITNVRLEHDVSLVSSLFERRMEIYGDVLYGGRSLMLLDSVVGRGAWDTYMDSQNIAERYPGMSLVAYIARINASQASQLERDLNTTKKVDEPFVRLKTSNNSAYAITSFVTPSDNFDILGNDLFLNESFKMALIEASDVGTPVSTSPLQSNAKNDKTDSVSLLIAVYDESYRKEMTAEQKQAVTKGYVAVSFRPEVEFNNGLTLLQYADDIAIEATDEAGVVMYSRNKNETGTLSSLTKKVNFQVGGKTWTVAFSAPIDYGLQAREKDAPIIVLIGGIMVLIVILSLYFSLRGIQVGFTWSESTTKV